MVKPGKFLRTVFIFYRGFRVPATLVTLFCVFGAVASSLDLIKAHKAFYGILTVVPPFFWIKTLTDAVILIWLTRFKAGERYFYCNLGVGTRTLWISVFCIDYLVFFLAMYLAEIGLHLFIRLS